MAVESPFLMEASEAKRSALWLRAISWSCWRTRNVRTAFNASSWTSRRARSWAPRRTTNRVAQVNPAMTTTSETRNLVRSLNFRAPGQQISPGVLETSISTKGRKRTYSTVVSLSPWTNQRPCGSRGNSVDHSFLARPCLSSRQPPQYRSRWSIATEPLGTLRTARMDDARRWRASGKQIGWPPGYWKLPGCAMSSGSGNSSAKFSAAVPRRPLDVRNPHVR